MDVEQDHPARRQVSRAPDPMLQPHLAAEGYQMSGQRGGDRGGPALHKRPTTYMGKSTKHHSGRRRRRSVQAAHAVGGQTGEQRPGGFCAEPSGEDGGR